MYEIFDYISRDLRENTRKNGGKREYFLLDKMERS